MSRPLALIAAFLTLPACAAESGDPLEDIPVFEMETPLVPGSPVPHPTPAVDNPRALARSGDLAFLGDSLFTVEAGQPLQVAVYGPEAEAVARRFGGRGSGPGEFESPLAINTAGGSVFVGDLGTERISVFDPAGELIAEMQARYPAVLWFAVAPDGAVYIPVSDANHQLLRLTPNSDPQDAPELFGERLLEYYRSGETPTLGRVAVDRSGRVHVYDSQLGVLIRFGPDGERQMAARLPPELDRELRGGPTGDAMPGGPSEAVDTIQRPPTHVKKLKLTADGFLLLLFTTERDFGLLVDPERYTARLLRIPAEAGEAGTLGQAVAATMKGDTVFALVQDYLDIYPLGPGAR